MNILSSCHLYLAASCPGMITVLLQNITLNDFPNRVTKDMETTITHVSGHTLSDLGCSVLIAIAAATSRLRGSLWLGTLTSAAVLQCFSKCGPRAVSEKRHSKTCIRHRTNET